MRPVHRALLVGSAALLALLAALGFRLEVGLAGWLAGVGLYAATCAFVLHHVGGRRLGPADRITLARAVLGCAVAAVVADGPHPATAATLASAALALDLVDGWAARRTGTASMFGARFDMEVDAALILVLSVAAARTFGWWVLGIGLARYAFAVAGRAAPWLRRPVPPSRWRKLVAAIQGVALTVSVSGVLPSAASRSGLIVAAALLAHSFGGQVIWLWRQGRERPAHRLPASVRRVGGATLTILSLGVVWFALLSPVHLDQFSAAAFLRVPVEGIVVIGLGLLLPDRARRVVALTTGAALGVLLILKVLDLGFYDVLDRPFNPVTDHDTLGPAIGVLGDALGKGWAHVAVALAAGLAFAVLLLVPLCVLRLTRFAARHRREAGRTVGVLAIVWLVAAALGLHASRGEPLASSSAAGLAYDHLRAAGTAIEDARTFAQALRAGHDPYSAIPAADVLTRLHGKDVLLVFVESYGQVAVQDSPFAAQDDALLRAATRRLAAAGYGARSAFLSSPTFGGISWLAHSTLQSGLWVDTQSRYDDLVRSSRYTLSDAFRRAGWRTVSDVPSDTRPWREGRSFYHYDALYNASNTGYRGPRLGYAQIPDQYTFAALRSLELAQAHRQPVFAEIDLVSSHAPWAPLPRMLPWSEVGDGSAYARQIAGQPTAATVWQHSDDVQAHYAESIRYSLSALVSYLETFHDRNLVLVVLGDHQPAKIVSGSDPTHDVPVSIIADDPAVLGSIEGWRWQPGLLPSRTAPVWLMDAFRDRFLDAYGSPPTTTVSATGRH